MEKKYLKYKTKYLNLKKQFNYLKGGSEITKYDNELDYNELIEELKKNLQNKEQNNLLLVVYAPWCHFCKEFLKPDASYNKLIELDTNIYTINGDMYTKELENIELEILGFPTIFNLSKKSHIPDTSGILDETILTKFNITDYAGNSNNIQEILDFKNQTF
jgi:hypothetical protein